MAKRTYLPTLFRVAEKLITYIARNQDVILKFVPADKHAVVSALVNALNALLELKATLS